jgi:hypothetical protein
VTFPQPAPTVPKTQLIADFITALGWDGTQETGYPPLPGPEITDAPDRALFLTPAGGPGWITEEAALDCWSFQARVRGPADDPFAPELAAAQLDVLILGGPYPQTVDGTVITLVARAGSPPSPLPLDPADRRFEYTCTYLITTGLE